MTVLEKAVETYGKDMQLTVAIEELSELVKEICKHKRGADNRDKIIEEMADCEIMFQQILIIFDISVDRVIDKAKEKLARLEARLAERSENGK